MEEAGWAHLGPPDPNACAVSRLLCQDVSLDIQFLHCSFLRQSPTGHPIPSLDFLGDSVFQSLCQMRPEDVQYMADALVGRASHLPISCGNRHPHLLLLVSKPTKMADYASISWRQAT